MDKNELIIQALIEEIGSKSFQIAELRANLTTASQRIAELEETDD